MLMLTWILLTMYSCGKSSGGPDNGNTPAVTPPASTPPPIPLSIVITNLSPATYLTLSLVDSSGATVLNIPGKNNDTTYVIPSVTKGEHFEATIMTNIPPAPGPDGLADVQFIYQGTELAGLSGGIYNQKFNLAVNIP